MQDKQPVSYSSRALTPTQVHYAQIEKELLAIVFACHKYVLCIDYYNKWVDIMKLDNETSKDVITHLKSMFARYGVPDLVISDNGPQYANAEFAAFSKSYEFQHHTSSPYHVPSNGEAERAVRR